MSRAAVGNTAKHVNTAAFRRSKIYGICQPDFLFETGDGVAFLEVKVGSKTSLNQVARYAALAAHRGVTGPVRLILLGKDARFAEVDGFEKLATGELEIDAKVAERLRQSELTEQDVAAQLRRMQLHRASFRELHGALSRELDLLDRSKEGEQTLHSLISGITNALIRRRLVGPLGAQPA